MFSTNSMTKIFEPTISVIGRPWSLMDEQRREKQVQGNQGEGQGGEQEGQVVFIAGGHGGSPLILINAETPKMVRSGQDQFSEPGGAISVPLL
jgi:hypothetical protein